jgi:anti-sigma B factor antagonist
MTQNVLVRPKVAFFQPCGAISATNALYWQDQFCQAVLSPETSSLIVDMDKLEFLDSAGLMVLVSVVKMARRHHKTLSVCSVPNSIRIILELAQIDRILDIHASSTDFAAA